MAIFLLLLLTLAAFVGYRIYAYKKQRQIEEMASDAQAYVSSEIVELLQQLKKISLRQQPLGTQLQQIHAQIKDLTENMVCHTDSEASVREYLSAAKQDLALIKVKLTKIENGESITDTVLSPANQYEEKDAFDALK